MCKPAQEATQIASNVYKIQALPILSLSFVAFVCMVKLSHPSQILDIVNLIVVSLDGFIETLGLELQRYCRNDHRSKWQRRKILQLMEWFCHRPFNAKDQGSNLTSNETECERDWVARTRYILLNDKFCIFDTSNESVFFCEETYKLAPIPFQFHSA